MTPPNRFFTFCVGCNRPLSHLTSEAGLRLHAPDRYCRICRTKILYDGYTREQLLEAYRSVTASWTSPNPGRFPALSQESIRLIDAAVVFYTGSKPVFEYLDGSTRVTVPGYYQSAGAEQ